MLDKASSMSENVNNKGKQAGAKEMSKIIEMFDVQRWDGGDRHNYEASFSSEEAAQSYMIQHDIMVKRTIVVHDTKEEALEYKNGKIKEKALAKLTELERKALGF